MEKIWQYASTKIVDEDFKRSGCEFRTYGNCGKSYSIPYFRQYYGETANPDTKTAIFSTWEDNRTILVGEGAKDAGGFKIDYAFDGFGLFLYLIFTSSKANGLLMLLYITCLIFQVGFFWF